MNTTVRIQIVATLATRPETRVSVTLSAGGIEAECAQGRGLLWMARWDIDAPPPDVVEEARDTTMALVEAAQKLLPSTAD
jgi:hypothetical protein